MKTLSVNGVSLAYDRHGHGAPLVLVHGFPLDHTSWEALVPLLEKEFDIILPDLRGFGESSSPEGIYSMDDLSADLAGLLDALGLPQAFLAGHSMGGYVCLAFARHFGERLLGLGMISSQAAPDAPERKAGRYATAEQVAAQGSSAVAGMAEKLSANPDHVPFIREMILRQKPAGVISALKAMAERPDSVPLLSTFQFPVVLVHGLADALIPPDRSRDMKDVIPSAHLVELPGVGHSPALEAPVETAGALKKLLR